MCVYVCVCVSMDVTGMMWVLENGFYGGEGTHVTHVIDKVIQVRHFDTARPF